MSHCEECPARSYCPDGASAPIACPAGKIIYLQKYKINGFILNLFVFDSKILFNVILMYEITFEVDTTTKYCKLCLMYFLTILVLEEYKQLKATNFMYVFTFTLQFNDHSKTSGF